MFQQAHVSPSTIDNNLHRILLYQQFNCGDTVHTQNYNFSLDERRKKKSQRCDHSGSMARTAFRGQKMMPIRQMRKTEGNTLAEMIVIV